MCRKEDALSLEQRENGIEIVYKLKPEFEKYFKNKPNEALLKSSMEFTKNQLFAEENKVEGYAVPSPFFWKVWNSSKREGLLQWLSDRKYELRQDGHLLGLRTNWIIYLPYEETIHIKQVLDEL